MDTISVTPLAPTISAVRLIAQDDITLSPDADIILVDRPEQDPSGDHEKQRHLQEYNELSFTAGGWCCLLRVQGKERQ